MHPILAIRAFFAALFGSTLPSEVIPKALLPEPPKEEPDLEAASEPPPPEKPVEKEDTVAEESPPEAVAIQALSIFQSEGRLLDFLFEEIEGYSDEEIGGAVREVHRGCKKALEDHFKLVPVRAEEEESMVTVAEGYNPSEVRLVGNVVGKPPFSGTLKHKGWRAEEVRLPQIPDTKALIVTPAEVEV